MCSHNVHKLLLTHLYNTLAESFRYKIRNFYIICIEKKSFFIWYMCLLRGECQLEPIIQKKERTKKRFSSIHSKF